MTRLDPSIKKKSSCLGKIVKGALILVGLSFALAVIGAMLPKKNTATQAPASKAASIILVPTFTPTSADAPTVAPTDTPIPSPTVAPPTSTPPPATTLPPTDTPISPTDAPAPTDAPPPAAAAPLVATEVAVPPTEAPQQMTYICDRDAYNCSDFSTHAEAQQVFDYCSANGFGDIHKLDGNDGDGQACESLP